MIRSVLRLLICLFLVILAMGPLASASQAANCNVATSQGTTGPANWQTYCWLDFTSYNDATARSASGQNFSFALADGTVMTLNAKVTSGSALIASTAPSWTGAAVGNTAFLGVGGRPILYQSAAGTSTVQFSNIVLTPPSGTSTITSYMFVAADAESSNEGESLRFQTNGGGWSSLDQIGPISGSTYPTQSGLGTSTFNVTGVAGTVGAYIVGSSTPTTVTATMVGSGLQGMMFAVRFASIRLNMQISGARANAADQFKFDIAATTGGTVLATGTSSGTGNGPFTSAALSSSSAIPLTLKQAMASGSTYDLTHYRSTLTCTNRTSGSSTTMPSGVVTSSYSFGAMQFGDNVQCTFTATPFPHLTLVKALASSGRQFTNDEFVLKIDQGTTTIATTTTTGSGATIGNGSTPQVQVTVGTVYAFNETGDPSTAINQYTATMACTNASSGTGTALPTAVGGSITPRLGDVVTCTITNTKRGSNATLSVIKTSTVLSDPVNGSSNPKAIPGAIVRYSLVVSNSGATRTDNGNTVFVLDALPSQLAVGTAATATFTQGAVTSGLTFTASTDLKFSNSASPPATFANCTYNPAAAYDPAVTYVCFNPQGRMAASSGTPPSFTLTMQAQIE